MKLYRLTLLLLAIPTACLLFVVARNTVHAMAAERLQAEMRSRDTDGDGVYWVSDGVYRQEPER